LGRDSIHRAQGDGGAIAKRGDKEPDLAVCGTASSGAETLEALDRLSPDLIILDLSLSDVDGTRLIGLVLEKSPGVRVLALSVYEEEICAERCLRAGARGYLNKRAAGEQVRDAIRTVSGGELFLSDGARVRWEAAQAPRRRNGSQDSGPEAFSDRELKLFQLLGRGFKPSQIALAMDLSIKTVESYRARMQLKLRSAGIDDLQRFAADWCRRHDR
jgi:DNA-binding NarL/FixJ family response regulator